MHISYYDIVTSVLKHAANASGTLMTLGLHDWRLAGREKNDMSLRTTADMANAGVPRATWFALPLGVLLFGSA